MTSPDRPAKPNAAVITPSDPETAAFVHRLVERGEAAERGPDGALPARVTHEIVGRTQTGLPIVKRVRFSGLFWGLRPGPDKSGWGTELIANKLAEITLGRGVPAYVIDSCPAIHTRPVGKNSRVHEPGRDEGFLVPQLAYNQLRTITGFRSLEAATRHMEHPKPLPRNIVSIELYMQKVRYARKLWANLFERWGQDRILRPTVDSRH
jgi:hypothetical protein